MTTRVLYKAADGSWRAAEPSAHIHRLYTLKTGERWALLENDRVMVIDPHTNTIVWQYGHTHVPGSAGGFLSNPDGVDLAPPYSLAGRFGASMHAP